MTRRRPSSKRLPVLRVFSAFIIVAMAVHLVRPLGLPGLRKRSDAWKLAVLATVVIAIVAFTKEG